MKPKTAKFFLHNVLGWTMDERPYQHDKCVILGFPHTCLMDYLIFALYMMSLDERPVVMVKKEAFFWPLSILLNKWQAIKTDRSRGAGVLKQCIEEFAKRDNMKLSLSPEGTRKPVKNWKTGFHMIAREAGVPVYLGYYDWTHKYITHGDPFEISDDLRADLLSIQKFYKQSPASGKYPERVAFPDGV